MMIKTVAAVAVLAGGVALAAPASADVLLIEQVHKEKTLNLPSRGMTMTEVEKTFGPPLAKLPVRGGHAPGRPAIKRWEYADFIVYFERNYVIHAVINPPKVANSGN